LDDDKGKEMPENRERWLKIEKIVIALSLTIV